MARHIVHKQKVELRVTRREDALALQSSVSRLLQNNLRQKMEALFDKLVPEGKVVRIDTLHLDLKTISTKNFEKEFEERFIEALQQSLSNKNDDPSQKDNIVVLGTHESLLQSLLHFLLHGYLPWYNAEKEIHSFQQEILRHFTANDRQYFFTWLKKNYKTRPQTTQRLVNQFTDYFLQELILSTLPIDGPAEAIYDDLYLITDTISGEIKQTKRTVLWQTIFNALLAPEQVAYFAEQVLKELFTRYQPLISKNDEQNSASIKTAEVKNAFENIVERIKSKSKADSPVPEKPVTPVDKKTVSPKKQMAAVKESSLYVQNCGVVLLHPFLEIFFRELGFTEDKQFISDDARKRAVFLLNYLATGKTEAAEFNLVLQKFVCGLPIEETLPAAWDLTETEISESQQLLRTVMDYWAPLKSTSIEGLQQTFLQREGKLIQTEEGWLLQVEKKTVDILLGKLPWGFSTIRLPWMQEILHVEWD
jgi:hypothetical protein